MIRLFRLFQFRFNATVADAIKDGFSLRCNDLSKKGTNRFKNGMRDHQCVQFVLFLYRDAVLALACVNQCYASQTEWKQMPTASVLLCDRCASRPTVPPPTTVGARSIDQAANILRPHASSLLLASLSRFPSSVSLNPSRGHLLPGDRKRTNEHHSTSTNDTDSSGRRGWPAAASCPSASCVVVSYC